MSTEEKKDFINKRLVSHYSYIESLGYEVIGIFLQGSQNYNLDIYEDDYVSDVDTKCLVLPTLNDLIEGKSMVSKKYDFEGEQIDVKDIRVMMEMWKKQNQSYLEILFTDYKIINPKYEALLKNIFNMKEDIVEMNIPQLARCISGMSKEKVAALEHEYPATIEKIKKYGYDPKQLASIIRLTHLIENIFEKNMDFKNAVWYNNGKLRDYMLDIKKGKPSLEEARVLAELYDNKTSSIKNHIVEQYGKDSFNNDIYNSLKIKVYQLVEFGILYLIQEQLGNAFKETSKEMRNFSEEENKIEEKIIKSLSVETKENFFDYYD